MIGISVELSATYKNLSRMQGGSRQAHAVLPAWIVARPQADRKTAPQADDVRPQSSRIFTSLLSFGYQGRLP